MTVQTLPVEHINLGDKTLTVQKLFVYGIFLGEHMRKTYGMMNPKYDCVPEYVTVGGHIVKAVHVGARQIALTGLVVDMPTDGWKSLDALEGGYDRIVIKTVMGTVAYMYADPRKEE